MQDLIDFIHDPKLIVAVLSTIAAVAAILSVGMPLLTGDKLSARMNYVARERSELRARERARLATEKKTRVTLRKSPKAYMQEVVDRLKLRRLLESADTSDKLKLAGYRGQSAMVTFLFFRVVLPPILFLIALFYVFAVGSYQDQPAAIKVLIALGAAYAGFFGPSLYITNRIKRRQQEIQRAFPDALDLLLICVESGMSVEQAFRRVSQEIGSQSIALAEELSLTTAELSYLEDRRAAYENLGKRTGLPGVKGITTALIQSERYGTPLGRAIRVMAQENRDLRMAAAEKTAAALPPKLTVPMIVFFLPVLFVVILGPSAIKLLYM